MSLSHTQVGDEDLDNMEFDGTAEDLERELQDMLAEDEES